MFFICDVCVFVSSNFLYVRIYIIQKLKEAEKERVSNLEEFERKANVQLERQLVMASDWSRALLTMRGKLKGTEWDPENSHRIDYSEFQRLLNSNNVQFMEYSNYGQTVSGWISRVALLFTCFSWSPIIHYLFLVSSCWYCNKWNTIW